MEPLKRLFREYNLIVAALTAFFAMALGLGWITLTPEQLGLVLGFLAALMLVIRFLVTPVTDPNLPIRTAVNVNDPNVQTGIVVPAVLDSTGTLVPAPPGP
jgi:hypothetical protein